MDLVEIYKLDVYAIKFLRDIPCYLSTSGGAKEYIYMTGFSLIKVLHEK